MSLLMHGIIDLLDNLGEVLVPFALLELMQSIELGIACRSAPLVPELVVRLEPDSIEVDLLGLVLAPRYLCLLLELDGIRLCLCLVLFFLRKPLP